MSVPQQLMMALNTPRKTTTSSDFSTSTYLTRGGDLAGVTNTAAGSISVWFRLDASNGNTRRLFINSSGYVEVQVSNANKLSVFISNAALSTYIQMTSTSSYTSGPAWHHLLASWDLNAGVGAKAKSLFIDGISEAGIVSDIGPASVVNYNSGNWTVSFPGTGHDGCLSELWFAPSQYLDFNELANRRKFANLSGEPVDLGATGAAPTGASPAVYLSNAHAAFPTNNGTGGDFSVAAGALTAGSTAP